MTRLHTVLSLTAAGLLAAGCSSTSLAPPPAPAPVAAATPTPGAQAAPGPAAAPAARSSVTTVSLPAYLDPQSDIARERSVYFDFDASTLKSDYAGLVERQGRYLASTPQLAVRVEGNADERGSAEYNLALGQRRAESVAQALRLYGVKDSQINVISWGEEKPRATGEDESALSQNRRADIVYPQK